MTSEWLPSPQSFSTGPLFCADTCTTPIMVAEFAGLPLGPQLLSIWSPRSCTFLPSNFTSKDPGAMNFVGPWVLAEMRPPPVAFDATSPIEPKLAPLMATALPSTFTVLV